MPTARKRVKVSSENDEVSTLQENEVLLDVLLEFMDLDTVGLLLQISPVCKAWRGATTRYLLRVRAPAYMEDVEGGPTKSDKADVIQTREDFIGRWKEEQIALWRAHSMVKPTPPSSDDCDRIVQGIIDEGRVGAGRSKSYEDAVWRYDHGYPFVVATNPLKIHLHSKRNTRDFFNENDHWYYVRISLGQQGQDWCSRASLEGVWRPTTKYTPVSYEDYEPPLIPPFYTDNPAFLPAFLADCKNTFERSQIRAARIASAEVPVNQRQDPFLLGDQLGSYVYQGEALQLRFDVSGLPWSREQIVNVKRINEDDEDDTDHWKYPYISVVAISKATNEPRLVFCKASFVKWNGSYIGEAQIGMDHEDTLAELRIETNPDGSGRKGHLTIVAFHGSIPDYFEEEYFNETPYTPI